MNRRGKSVSGRVQTGLIKKKPRQDQNKALLPMKNLCFPLSARALLLAGAATVAGPAMAAAADTLSDVGAAASADQPYDTGTRVPESAYDDEVESAHVVPGRRPLVAVDL